MIFIETWYKTHDQELLAIVEAFKTWCHYLKGYKYEVLVFTDHNNFHQFMDTKNLSFCQVCWAQKLFSYHFQINYCQEKANVAADTLSCFLQRSQAEEKMLKNKITQILHYLQTSLINVSIARLSLSSLSSLEMTRKSLLPLYRVLIYGTHV